MLKRLRLPRKPFRIWNCRPVVNSRECYRHTASRVSGSIRAYLFMFSSTGAHKGESLRSTECRLLRQPFCVLLWSRAGHTILDSCRCSSNLADLSTCASYWAPDSTSPCRPYIPRTRFQAMARAAESSERQAWLRSIRIVIDHSYNCTNIITQGVAPARTKSTKSTQNFCS